MCIIKNIINVSVTKELKSFPGSDVSSPRVNYYQNLGRQHPREQIVLIFSVHDSCILCCE